MPLPKATHLIQGQIFTTLPEGSGIMWLMLFTELGCFSVRWDGSMWISSISTDGWHNCKCTLAERYNVLIEMPPDATIQDAADAIAKAAEIHPRERLTPPKGTT